MKLLCLHSDKELDRTLMAAFGKGAARHGVEVEIEQGGKEPRDGADIVALFGVKARLKFEAYRARGVHTIMLDKGYVRHASGPNKWCEYWRVAVDAHHPTRYLGRLGGDGTRFLALGLVPRPWRRAGAHIVLAGSSEKYHRFNGLPHPTGYAEGVVAGLRAFTDRPIVYRPKPSWKDAAPIAGAGFSRFPERLTEILEGAHALVTDGSNACFEAALLGVPSIILGDAVARPISSTALNEIETPRLAGEAERRAWFADLGECQWTMTEMGQGLAWAHVMKVLSLPSALSDRRPGEPPFGQPLEGPHAGL